MTVKIARLELTPSDLRREAARTKDADAARRMLAIALLLEGHGREQAARQSGMDRQTLRDWVHRYNSAGCRWSIRPPARRWCTYCIGSASGTSRCARVTRRRIAWHTRRIKKLPDYA
jgi:Winged helix-turn helix